MPCINIKLQNIAYLNLESLCSSRSVVMGLISVSDVSEVNMMSVLRSLREEAGQDIAEYAVMLAVILAVVVGTIRLIGSNANNVFSAVGSAIQ
jgi:Flp pilus assembly pilin Flp